jgi:deoxyadenosine/deoxycytidine kinase
MPHESGPPTAAPTTLVVALHVEGCIGVGKSTVLATAGGELERELAAALAPRTCRVRLLQEPLERWTNVCAGEGPVAPAAMNLLEAQYADPSRWFCTMQTHVITTRTQQMAAALTEAAAAAESVDVELWLVERSAFSSHSVFAQIGVERGLMTPLEEAVHRHYWALVQHAWKGLAQARFQFARPRHLYLRAPAEDCLARTRQRARAEEAPIPLDFMQSLVARHDVVFDPASKALLATVFDVSVGAAFDGRLRGSAGHTALVDTMLDMCLSACAAAAADQQL